MTYFAVSDVHSYFEPLKLTLNIHGFEIDNPNHVVIICGDLFDRGPDSLSCFNFVKQLAAENRLIYIRGNHEDLLKDCVRAIRNKGAVGSHHIHNGTIRTISHFINCSEQSLLNKGTVDWKIFDTQMNELLDFIDKNCVDYFELGTTLFVHGWVPITSDDEGTAVVPQSWREEDWKSARWENGIEMYCFDIFPSDVSKVVCGHWHASYAWHLFRGYPEWGQSAKFDTFVGEGIVALDACTVTTSIVNCAVFDDTGKLIEY